MPSKSLTAVTGANGFIGRALCDRLIAAGQPVRRLVRRGDHGPSVIAVGEVGPDTDWLAALDGVECVIHCAGRAHVLLEKTADPLAEFRRVNVQGTRRLAEQAAASGVRRLVFLSSIGVHGVHTRDRGPFRHDDPPAPVENYGISKLEAESALSEVAEHTGLELVVVRPPLVHGPGVHANFLRLLQLIASGVPLPLGSVRNRRSLVSLTNLVDLLRLCTEHPAATGRAFLVSDGEDLSTPDLVRKLAAGMDKPARLLPVPLPLLLFAARVAGRSGEVERLVDSLQVDTAYTCETLGWIPPLAAEEGLRATAEWYARQRT